MFNAEIIKPQAIDHIIAEYNHAASEIAQAYQILDQARERLSDAFQGKAPYNSSFRVLPSYDDPASAMQKVQQEIKLEAWRVIVRSLNIHKIASTKRIDDMNKQLETGKDLPELTTAAVFDILMTLQQNKDEIFNELVKEVFDYLRPVRSVYKTNTEFEIGKKVILSWCVEHGYHHQYKLIYQRENKVLAIDKLFHLLDGKGIPEGYKSPLVDAINTSEGTGETAYFRFKCHHNMNLHLEFKRMDLVNRLNALAGGMNLRKG